MEQHSLVSNPLICQQSGVYSTQGKIVGEGASAHASRTRLWCVSQNYASSERVELGSNAVPLADCRASREIMPTRKLYHYANCTTKPLDDFLAFLSTDIIAWQQWYRIGKVLP